MTATISECGKYRYNLSRRVNDTGDGVVVFVMLNPSTADANLDDPTVRRCKGFAEDWGFEELKIVNLYAYRATNPKELLEQDNPIGDDNDFYIRDSIKDSQCVVFAWGNNAKIDRVRSVYDIVKGELNITPKTLGVTKKGHPKHPLYIKRDQELKDWDSGILFGGE